jgi:hypothetical protein
MDSQILSRWLPMILVAVTVVYSGSDAPEQQSPVVKLASQLGLSPQLAMAQSTPPALPDLICPLGAAKAETAGPLQGHRRLALVVGVGDYLSPKVPKLDGAPKDAEKVYDLLVNPATGFGFPKENVCFMKNHAATHAAFRDKFQKALVDRAQDDDVVVIYFAGHGSQSPDSSGDEADGLDETLMLVDARYNGEIDLVDDEFNYLLSGLFNKMSGAKKGKAQKVTVVLDSCNSGTAARAADSPLKARYFEADKVPFDKDPKSNLPAPKTADSSDRWDGDDLPGLVFVSAAIDGTSAHELGGEGLFTKGLLQSLKESAGKPMTYNQLVLRIRQLIPSYSAGVNQTVDAQGGKSVENLVFGASTVARPPSYDVKEVDGNQVTLTGTALPGWSSGAEVRIYAWPPSDESTTRNVADLQDPKRSKGTLILDNVDGLGAKGRLQDGTQNGTLASGDIAVLAKAGKDIETLKVSFIAEGRPGGVPAPRKHAILKAISEDTQYKATLVPVEGPGGGVAWTVGMNSAGRLQLFDPNGALRSTNMAEANREAQTVAENLHQMARQRALLQRKGEAGDDFVNDKTVQVWAEAGPSIKISAADARTCPKQNVGYWDPEKNGPGTHALEIPLCHSWVVKAKVSADSPVPLYVGGLILSGDGSIIGFPGGAGVDEPSYVLVKPGDTYTFKMRLLATPPINIPDYILVFGNREANKVEWSRMSETAATRGVSQGQVEKATTWTSTTLTSKVLANSLIAMSADPSGTKAREYTVQKYDIREQLPESRKSALYKLLMKTDELTNHFAGNADGPRYNQDTEGRWYKLSDQENLAKGIDCSRAIWYAFTRVGLQYAKAGGPKNAKQPEFWSKGAYLSTEQMIDAESLRLDQIALRGPVKPSPMRDQFQSCRSESQLRQGDVLVYRRLKGDPRADGHVVMVIDPNKNIAWGSHAWDGAAPKGSPTDTGVEYQWIKSIKKGLDRKWDAWDKANMVQVDCWRHKQIAKEWDESLLNRAGTYDISVPLAQANK